MTLDQVKDRDAEIVNDALREAFKRAGIPTSVAVDDPECIKRLLGAAEEILDAISMGFPLDKNADDLEHAIIQAKGVAK